MTEFDLNFISFILIILIAFGFLIAYLLIIQRKQLNKNLLLTGIDIWNLVKGSNKCTDLDEKNLLFGLLKHPSFTEVSFIQKNFKDEILAETLTSTLNRKRTLTVREQKLSMTFPLSWTRTIILQEEESHKVLAKYVVCGWLGKHEIQVPGYGTYLSSRVSLDFKGKYSYSKDGLMIGYTSNTLCGNPKASYALLPDSLPLEVRLFMLLC